MADRTPTTRTNGNGTGVTLDVLRSPIAAMTILGELTEHRARVVADARVAVLAADTSAEGRRPEDVPEAGLPPLVGARLFALDRTIGQLRALTVDGGGES